MLVRIVAGPPLEGTMFGLGLPELLLILLLVVLIFGTSRIPELGKGLGEGIKNFKKGIREAEVEEDDDDKKKESSKPSAKPKEKTAE